MLRDLAEETKHEGDRALCDRLETFIRRAFRLDEDVSLPTDAHERRRFAEKRTRRYDLLPAHWRMQL